MGARVLEHHVVVGGGADADLAARQRNPPLAELGVGDAQGEQSSSPGSGVRLSLPLGGAIPEARNPERKVSA